ncbi:MAG: hypothetical protein ACRDTX_02625 [Pseudonocardiaceae bacterium]
MSDVMSSAEVDDQLVELLPARTVLSALQATPGVGIPTPGAPGNHGSDGASVVGDTFSVVSGTTSPSTITSGVGA